MVTAFESKRPAVLWFTGLDDPYEPPERPELTLDTRVVSVAQASHLVLEELRQRMRQS